MPRKLGVHPILILIQWQRTHPRDNVTMPITDIINEQYKQDHEISVVWMYFNINDNTSDCDCKLSRGGMKIISDMTQVI